MTAVPAAYVVRAAGRVRAAMRADLEPVLAAWLLAPRLALPADAEPLAGGRGGTHRVTLAGGVRAIVRPYRRGGLVARLVRETYLGLRPRPLRELAVTAEVRRRGVAAAEVLAARVEGGVVYRGVLVTAEVPAAATLAQALRAAPDPGARCTLAAAAGEAIGALHAAGVFHADLNLTNILVHGREPAIALVDFDRARLAPPPLAAGASRRNLRRLARSLAKHGLDGLAGPEERRAFRRGYLRRRPLEDACAC
jgi:3-deoxy-D-manno-octulosonic acid kinase